MDGGKFTDKFMKDKISFEQLCDPAFRREQQMKVKSEAVWVAFLEMRGLINISEFSRRYFGKSQSWFAQKLHGNNVCNKERAFTPEECHKIADSFRYMAMRLNEYADVIDNAKE